MLPEIINHCAVGYTLQKKKKKILKKPVRVTYKT